MENFQFKSIIFDMDGTLLNTLEDIADSVNYVLTQLGHPTHPLDEYRLIVGAGARDHVKKSLPLELQQDEAHIDHAFTLYKKQYAQNWKNKTTLYPGIKELLTYLELHFIPFAVISNKPDEFLQNVMTHFFASWHFIDATGAIDQHPVKPHPYLVEKIMAHNNFKKEETLFVGDSAIDIETAKRAGLKSCGCLWGFRDAKELQSAGADFIIAHPRELERLLGLN